MLFSVRRKIGVAAFRRNNLIAFAVPNKKRFAEAGARGEERTRTAGFRFAFIEDEELFWIEVLDAVSPGAEIIEQNDVSDAELLRKDGSVNRPREICGADTIVDDGTGDAESSGENFFSGKM